MAASALNVSGALWDLHCQINGAYLIGMNAHRYFLKLREHLIIWSWVNWEAKRACLWIAVLDIISPTLVSPL